MVDAKVEYVAPFFFAKQAALDSNAQPITHFDGEKLSPEAVSDPNKSPRPARAPISSRPERSCCQTT